MQIHNLLDYKTHLPVLREWKAAGKIRYLGVTHYQRSQFDLIEKLMRDEALDFIQIPYSIVNRSAEDRILPTAADTGTGVLVMQPFESGALFNPAVTCPIPATSNPTHVADNLRAGFGPLPDAKQRTQLIAAVG